VSAVAVLPLAYLIGSIPFSFLVARRFGVSDVRRVGSGNVGATNVLRSAGRTAGALAFLLDAAKGAGAVALARALGAPEPVAVASAVAAILGHVFPVWLSFRGGKGVATGAGAFLPLVPLGAGAGLLVFAFVLRTTRYVAVASICGACAVPLAAWLLGTSEPVVAAAAAVALLIVWTHRTNLRRLATGTEARIGDRA
jgi:glycerol-3-phosphate acyltransferase PlsY